ncbi:phage baseplate assembly protein V [Stenotrophomonas sp. CD2]|nr:phage baseplate assembly protein V [Stenotrophomonas sp. CD2]
MLTGTPGALPTELLLVTVEHAGVNNLPTDLRHALAADTAPDPFGTLLGQAREQGYAQDFVALQREQRWRPVLDDGTGARRNPRPLAPGYQTAIVVAGQGSDGGELHADALGRIRVRFHFQGEQGDAGSAWLRVAQRYAGPGVGSQFLPRIGQEVLIGFLEGDIDRPLVLGALYNGRGEAGVAPTPAGANAELDTSAYAQARDGGGSAQANWAVAVHRPACGGGGRSGASERRRAVGRSVPRVAGRGLEPPAVRRQRPAAGRTAGQQPADHGAGAGSSAAPGGQLSRQPAWYGFRTAQ